MERSKECREGIGGVVNWEEDHNFVESLMKFVRDCECGENNTFGFASDVCWTLPK